MLSAHKNLADVCDIDAVLQLFNVADMSFQNFDDVSIQGGILQYDDLSLPSLQEGVCAVVSGTHKVHTISDWFMKPQCNVSIDDFRPVSYETDLFVRMNQLNRFSFSGDIRDLDFSTHLRYPLSKFLKETGRKRFADQVLYRTLGNLTDPQSARVNLSVSDICKCNQFPSTHDALMINNLHIPHCDMDGLLNYFPNDGSFEAVSRGGLPTASFTRDGVLRFSDANVAHPDDIYYKSEILSNALFTKMQYFEPTLVLMREAVTNNKDLLFSKFEEFADVDSVALKERIELGTLHSVDSNNINISGTGSTIVKIGEFTVPNLALKRHGGTRNNTESTALYQVVTDKNARLSNIPYDFFSLATPIDSNIALLEPSIDSNMGIVYVYESHEMKSNPTHIYQTHSNNFAMSYRLFLKDAQSALDYVQGITNTVKMEDYSRENNIRMVNFDSFSNTYSNQLSGLSENVAKTNDTLSQGLFSELTSNYLTSNMLRPDMNMGEIQLLFSNQLNNNLVDFDQRFAKIVEKDTDNLISQSDYEIIGSVLRVLSNQQRERLSGTRDYLHDSDKRARYLEDLYQNLELSRIAWSNSFSNLHQKPSGVSQFMNDQGYLNMFDPFHEYKNKHFKQMEACRNIGIGSIALQNTFAVDIDCDTFDASYVHTLSSFERSLSVAFDSIDPFLLKYDAGDHNGKWTRAPVFSFLDYRTPGLVKFTNDPMSIDNNSVLSLSNLRFKQRELEIEFQLLFRRIESEYSKKGLDVKAFVNPSDMYLLNFKS